MTENNPETGAPETAPATPKAAPKSAPKASKSKPKAPKAQTAAPAAPALPAALEPMSGFAETLEEITAFQKANFEALMASGKSWTKGMGAVTGAAFEIGRKNYEKMLSANKELMACDSFQDAFEVRATLTRDLLDESMADATRLSELATKAAKEAAEPIQERYNLALDGIWKAA